MRIFRAQEGGRSVLKAFQSWSLVTVSYNSGEKLQKYWQSDRPAHVEWIVVDNGSTDDSVFQAKKLGARVIALERNVGFGAANNIGFALAKSSFIGFVNPDVKVDFSSLDHMGETLTKSQVLLAPQLIDDNGNLQPNGRGLPTIWAKIFSRLRAGSASGRGYLLLAEKTSVLPVHWFIGAAVLSTRAVFEGLGPWDERFFIYYEDSDIGLRAWAQGIPVGVDGAHNWVHGWARETSSFKIQPWRREIASMAKFYSRYPALLLPRRLALACSSRLRAINLLLDSDDTSRQLS